MNWYTVHYRWPAYGPVTVLANGKREAARKASNRTCRDVTDVTETRRGRLAGARLLT